MRRENENLSDYLLRIHEEELGYEYRSEEVQARVLIRKYKEFVKALNLHDDMTDEEEKMFREFIRTNETLKSFYKKGSGQTAATKKLQDLYIRTNEYFKTVLYPHYVEEAKCLRPKEAQIHMMDMARLHSVPKGLEPNSFLQHLEEQWDAFMKDYVYVVSSPEIEGHSLSQAVDDEIEYYKYKYNNYNKPSGEFEGAEIEYYNGQNDNPYKNLYIYCLFQYVSYFLATKLPVFSVEKFTGIEALKAYKDKHTLSLRDVAEAYSLIDNTTADKAYERLKKQFQKYDYFEGYKNGIGEYQFHDITEPLAFSETYRKKDTIPSDYTDFMIRYVYCKLIAFAIDGKIDNISALKKYHSFFEESYMELIKTVYISDAKFSTFLDILIGTAGRISLRLLAPKEKVDMMV